MRGELPSGLRTCGASMRWQVVVAAHSTETSFALTCQLSRPLQRLEIHTQIQIRRQIQVIAVLSIATSFAIFCFQTHLLPKANAAKNVARAGLGWV